MEIIPQSSVIGAEVLGVDLGKVDAATRERIDQAFLDH